jgi:DNA-binding NarL/FixJ family response regulator
MFSSMTNDTAQDRCVVPAHSGGIIRILVVDDHQMLRDGIASMLSNEPDMDMVGEAGDGASALSEFRRLRPDVTLMDVQMPGMGGVDAMLLIREEFPDARIVILTTYPGDVQAVRALKAGASGYMLKSSLRSEVVDVIRSVHRGERYVAADVAAGIARHVADDPLTLRETAVLRLVSTGRANREVALHLGISEETVKAHMKSIFAKLNVCDRTHAVTTALRRGVLEI